MSLNESTSNEDDVPGIRPEDVELSHESKQAIDNLLSEQKSDILKAHEEELAEADLDLVELHDSEYTAAAALLMELQGKYGPRTASYENLLELKNEAEEKFGNIGLKVQVDWILSGLSIKPQPPVITIVGRTTPYDPERNRYELGKGMGDPYFDYVKKLRKRAK